MSASNTTMRNCEAHIAINGSPRSGWNTEILVHEAAGSQAEGAEVETVDL